MKTYTVETKNRKAVVVTGALPIIKNMEVVGYMPEETTVCIYFKKTGKLLATYELPEFKEFSSYTALVKHCKELRLQHDLAMSTDQLCPPTVTSTQLKADTSIAPKFVPTTRGDTPLYFILQRYPRKTTIVIKDGQNELFKWHTSIHKPTVHLGWNRIKKVVAGREIVFRNRFEQSHFSWLVKKSFDCDRSLQFSDLLKNKYSFIE